MQEKQNPTSLRARLTVDNRAGNRVDDILSMLEDIHRFKPRDPCSHQDSGQPTVRSVPHSSSDLFTCVGDARRGVVGTVGTSR